jgi:hypothetical protein
MSQNEAIPILLSCMIACIRALKNLLYALHTHTLKLKKIAFFRTQFYQLFIMQLHDRFETIKATRDAIKRYVLDNGESLG